MHFFMFVEVNRLISSGRTTVSSATSSAKVSAKTISPSQINNFTQQEITSITASSLV
jgi:hypothetical protein